MRNRAYDRHGRILDLLKEENQVDVGMIARKFNISLATARRDFSILESEGKLLRTFGGARAKDEPSFVAKTFGEKLIAMHAAKVSMARAAAKLVKPGMKLIMDSGTTTWAVSKQIKHLAPLTIITASIAIVEECGTVDGITLFCAGGKFRAANLDFYGPQTCAALGKFAADIAFVGVDKLIPGRGAYAADQESATMIHSMSAHANKLVVMADHSKIDSSGFILALENKEIDVVITDAGISAAQRRQLAKKPYKLIVAN